MAKANLSHYRLITADMGNLIPAGLTEVLPGDTFQHGASCLVRLSPLAAPIMHPATVRLHHFFVPHRLIWDGFEDFITGGPDGNDAQTVPTVQSTGTPFDLCDYFGIPNVAGRDISALPFRGFNLIFNEYYRDQDLTPERDAEDMTLPNIAWEKDYFTSARPWPQKGDDVTIPLGDSAPVKGLGKLTQTFLTNQTDTMYETGGVSRVYSSRMMINDATNDNRFYVEQDAAHPGFPAVYADLAQATGMDVRDVRLAFALQRYQEARARYGSRYVEYLRYLGVRPRDARLDRPEYLGGGSSQVNISEVIQTAPDDPTDTEYGVGDLYGHGISAMRSPRYRRFFDEHGYVISLLSVRPKTVYQDGIPRTFLRQDKEDFWQRELQDIGQQAVWADEIYAGGGREIWGYQDRYREYLEQESKVTGEFRELLNYWHMARKFDSAPTLNGSFIRCDPTKRIYNEQTQHSLWIMLRHSLIARRKVRHSSIGRMV